MFEKTPTSVKFSPVPSVPFKAGALRPPHRQVFTEDKRRRCTLMFFGGEKPVLAPQKKGFHL